MTKELLEKLKNAKSNEEVKQIIEDCKSSLTDEELEQIGGGFESMATPGQTPILITSYCEF